MLERPPGSGSTLAALFASMAMARLVVFFAVHPEERFHLRELKRRTRLSSSSLQRELQRLVNTGALARERTVDGRVYYSAIEAHDAWRAWALLLRSAADPADVLREALVDATGLEVAFIFGSAVRPDDVRPDSDIDVFLITRENRPAQTVRRQLSEVEFLIGRRLDVVEYSTATARQRIRAGNSFVSRVLAEPKTWVCAGPERLSRMEAA